MTDMPVELSCSICTLLLLVGTIFTWRGAQSSMGTLSRATAWAEPQDWRIAECKVLATGVACVERDTHTTCGGYGGDGVVKTVGTGTVVYDFKDIAVCPGSYWCAKEGDMCTCDGEVAFATELFNGTGYTAFDDATYRMSVAGVIKCGLGLNGLPLKDPAPYWVKHCWCTPKAIVERLSTAGAVFRKPRDCDKDFVMAKDDFFKSQASQSRRLGDEAADEEENEDLAEEAAEVEPAGGADGRRLTTTHHSPRRRRTYTYTPWALVEVPPQEDDGFGERESKVPVVTCAYEFGTPEDSLGDYTSDGPYASWIGDSLWMAKKAAEKANAWAQDSKNKCFVRTVGAAGKDTCSVALDMLQDLVGRRANNSGLVWRGMWICFAMFLTSALCTIGLFAKKFMPSSDQEKTNEEAQHNLLQNEE